MVPPTETSSYAVERGATPWARNGAISARRTWSRKTPPATLGRRFVDRSCRVLNIVAAVVLLTAALPIMAVVAMAVRFSSPGPVIFRQKRVGLDRRDSRRVVATDRRCGDEGGRIFDIYKFRTMYVSPGEGDQVWAGAEKHRITPVGRVLRSFRIDEIPQLWNVLKGDMNIVGPRPEQPRIFGELRDELDRYSARQKVLPGITGLAQVSQGYDQTVEDVKSKLGFDLEYIERRTPLEDLRIMARTAPVMLFRKGAR